MPGRQDIFEQFAPQIRSGRADRQGIQIHDLSEEDRSAQIGAMQPVWKHLGTDLVGEDVMLRLRAIGEGNDF